MKRRYFLAAGFLLLLICLSRDIVMTQNPSGPAENADELNILVNLQGQASVKRKGWSTYVPAMFGVSVRRGDLLRVEAGTQAKVVCAGLTLQDVPNGIGGVPCPTAKPVLRYRHDLAVSTRGGQTPLIPIILSPRKTKLLDPYPTLQWTAVTGAEAYQVVVRGANLNWGTVVRGATQVKYPEYAPPLKSGEIYKMIVATNQRRSDEESEPSLGFSVLSSDEAKSVRKEEKKIYDLGLPAPATGYLTARLFASYGLYAEAISQLESLTKSLKEPALMQTLGDLYLAIGLTRRSETYYLSALSLSTEAKDDEGQSLSHQALGRIYDVLGNRAQASQHYQAAKKSAEKLGDSIAVSQIDARLATLK